MQEGNQRNRSADSGSPIRRYTQRALPPRFPRAHRGDFLDGEPQGSELYQLLSGQLPFRADNAAELFALHLFQPAPALQERVPEAPAPLCALIHSMLEKEKERRPTMKQAADELAQILALYPTPPAGTLSAPLVRGPVDPSVSPSQPSFPSSPQVQRSTLGSFTGQQTADANHKVRWVLSLVLGLLLGGSAITTTAVLLMPARSARSAAGKRAPAPAAAVAPVPAPTPADAPRQVRWTITSEPSGAEVLRAADRSLLGTTPYVRNGAAGSQQELLVLRAIGFEDRRITLEQGADATLHVRMQRRAPGPRPGTKRKTPNDRAPLPIMP